MRAAFEEYNDNSPDIKRQCAVMSMDVKALYPSIEWGEIVIAVREIMEMSDEMIENVDYNEVGRYLAVSLSKEEIKREGRERVVPKGKIDTGREISVAYLCDKNNNNKWQIGIPPDRQQQKRMVAIAVAVGVRACISNHVYCVCGG